MKILLLSPQPFFRVRGTPINVKNVASALAEDGHSVDLLCYPFGEEIELSGVRILRSPSFLGIRDVKVGPSLAKIPLDGLMFFSALRLCMKHTYDVIHGIEEAGFMAGLLSRWFRCHLVYDMDSCISDQLRYSGTLTWGPALRVIEGLEARTMRRASFVLTVCKALSDVVARLAPSARVVQIEDAPLEEAFVEDVVGADRLRGELGLVGKRVFVYTGNLEGYQGIDFLLESLVHAKLDRVDACCLLVGGEGAQVEAFIARSRELGVDSVCHFMGKRPMDEMPAFLTLADGLVSPRTQGSNTALKVYGYMQSGRPIVATRLETHTQVLNDGNAFLVEATPEAFAAGLREVLSDADAGARGRAAAVCVERSFSLGVFKGRVAEAYRSLG